MVDLPVLDDFRCSSWTRLQNVDPTGSATVFEALLLVESPLPWPRDISEIAELTEAATDQRAAVLAVVPQPAGAGHDLVRVVHRRRETPQHFIGVDHLVPRAGVRGLLSTILEDVQSDHVGLPSAVGRSPDDLLVCGHGRRDRCCGRWGTLLQMELAARLPHVRVWRCSHTGGHRFAPTAITAVDGRAWAFADAELIAGIVDRSAAVRTLAGHYRGSAAVPGWAQPVEATLFFERGWKWTDCEITEVGIELGSGQRDAAVRLAWREPGGAAFEATATVVVSRDIPVLTCGEHPDAAVKSSFEFAVHALSVTQLPC